MPKSRKTVAAEAGLAGKESGLVLDDCLNQFHDVRRRFKLATPTWSIRLVERQAGAKAALGEIIKGILDRHGSEIYSKTHPLLADLGKEIYGEPIVTVVYSGLRIQKGKIEQTLRKIIEVAVQTIVQLPCRESRSTSVPKRLKAAANALTISADKLCAALTSPDVRRYIELLDDQANLARISAMPHEIRETADSLRAAASLKVKKLRMNSPNLQTSMAMYFIGWLRVATGRLHYEGVTVLLQATFSAAGRPQPRWIDRLAIEMHGQKKLRGRWIRTISS